MPEDSKDEVLGDLAEFDQQFNETEEAPEGGGLLIPPGTYHCGVQDYTWLKSKEKGTRGLKIAFEVVEPAVMKDDKGKEVETVGKVINHVFWITEKNLPYVKRDVHKILRREIASIRELADINWMECFAELVTRHEENPNGWMENRVRFFNSWNPSDPKQGEEKPAGQKKETDAAF